MAGTAIAYGKKPSRAEVDGDGAWLPVAGLAEATGWSLKPEGVCRDDVCVPIPRGKESEFVRDGTFNVLRFAEHMGQPAVREPGADLVVVGEAASERHARLSSLAAPDFELPDLQGNNHRLSSYRGKKVLVVTWASW